MIVLLGHYIALRLFFLDQKSEIQKSESQGEHHAKTQIVVPKIGMKPEAIRTTREVRKVAPGTAAVKWIFFSVQ